MSEAGQTPAPVTLRQALEALSVEGAVLQNRDYPKTSEGSYIERPGVLEKASVSAELHAELHNRSCLVSEYSGIFCPQKTLSARGREVLTEIIYDEKVQTATARFVAVMSKEVAEEYAFSHMAIQVRDGVNVPVCVFSRKPKDFAVATDHGTIMPY